MDKLITFKVAKLAKEMGFEMTTPSNINNTEKVYLLFGKTVYDQRGYTYKGKDVCGFSVFSTTDNINYFSNKNNMFGVDTIYAPTQNELYSWLREKNIFIDIRTISDNGKIVYAYTLNFEDIDNDILSEYYDTYEDALEAAIEEGIYLVIK